MAVEAVQEEERLGSISIENGVLKEGLSEGFSQMIEGVIGLIKYSIKLESEQVEEYIGTVMGKL